MVSILFLKSSYNKNCGTSHESGEDERHLSLLYRTCMAGLELCRILGIHILLQGATSLCPALGQIFLAGETMLTGHNPVFMLVLMKEAGGNQSEKVLEIVAVLHPVHGKL